MNDPSSFEPPLQKSSTSAKSLSRSEKAKLLVEALKSPIQAGGENLATSSDQSAETQLLKQDRAVLLSQILQEFRDDLDQKIPSKPDKKKQNLDQFRSESRPRDVSPPAINYRKFEHDAASLQLEHPAISAIVLSSAPTGKVTAVLKAMKQRHAQKTALLLARIESRRQIVPTKSRKVIAARVNINPASVNL